MSSLITTDILSVKDFLFVNPRDYLTTAQTFDVAVVNDAPTVVLVDHQRIINIYTLVSNILLPTSSTLS